MFGWANEYQAQGYARARRAMDEHASRAQLASEFLKTHKKAYSFEFRYRGGQYWAGFFASHEELEREQAEFLFSINYQPRRFWEFWRAGETKPTKTVLARLTALNAR